MRLICPNCGAQYEVPDDVIPEEGRDVQCSNCGDTWFQNHGEVDPEISGEDDELQQDDWPETASAPATAESGEEQFAAPVSASAADHSPSQPYDDDRLDGPETDDAADQAEDAQDTVAPDVPPAELPRRALDPAVSDLLRQEAEHEARARRSETPEAFESQPDLGLDAPDEDAARRAREARNRMARLRGEPETQAAQLAAAASRRDLLPDIEEINSTLRSTSDRRDAAAGEAAAEPLEFERNKHGFRRGFMLVVLLAIVLAILYILAPKLTALLPAAGPLLESYVALIDSARLWLDGQFGALMLWLDTVAASSNG